MQKATNEFAISKRFENGDQRDTVKCKGDTHGEGGQNLTPHITRKDQGKVCQSIKAFRSFRSIEAFMIPFWERKIPKKSCLTWKTHGDATGDKKGVKAGLPEPGAQESI